jgi:glutamate dehydrogenase (NAD(P)+)
VSAGGPEPRVIAVESDGEPLGFVAIDSTIRGRARGGLRMAEDLSASEIGDAARAMTLKYGLLGLPQGGAKAGVRGDPTAPLSERRERLLKFARAIAPLLRERAYLPDADLGTRAPEIRWMLQQAGIPVFAREWRSSDSGAWTAASVLGAMRAALESRRESLAGRTIAIEGFGAVGSALARMLAAAGARIVAISTSLGAIHDPRGLDVDRLETLMGTVGHRLVEHYPAIRSAKESLFEVAVDVLSPCARRHSIHAGNAAAVKARLICPGANNPVSPEAETILLDRGAMSLPDFVCNCGGVLGGTMAFASIPNARIPAFVEASVQRIMNGMLATSGQSGVTLRTVAERLARERFEHTRDAASRTGLRAALFATLLDAYRRGWIPGWALHAASQRYFERLVRL